jgi:ubiquinone/menaquinone biosynthesis C-methylase UbiE
MSSSEANYDVQHRGDRGAYDRYLASMDASMKQKIALTAAHFLCQGTIADMGMGSGAGSLALASLYPALKVIGVDINETMVKLASDNHKLENLSFVTGDIAKSCFENNSLHGIFNSSVLHHVTSFSDYDHQSAQAALEVQSKQLRTDGILIVRDFLAPNQNPQVWLDVSDDDGDHSDNPRTCSTAALLRLFAKQFRKLSKKPGFDIEVIPAEEQAPIADGHKRFQMSLRHAVEFLLRKDYKADWETEVLEEYTYFDKKQFEQVFARLGLRSLASVPIRNPWIVAHRLRGKYKLRTLDGQCVDYPATNYIIVGEKIPAGQGVAIEAAAEVESQGFLSLDYYRQRQTKKVMEVVRRPHLTVDVLPWFEFEGDLFVVARKGYPRPIVGCKRSGNSPLNDCTPSVYVTEPLNVLQDDKPLGQTVEEALRVLASIPSPHLKSFDEGGHYYPSPGGIQEEVRSLLVEIEALFVQKDIENLSGFSTSGQVRAIEACQALRAAQVSGLPSNRLEINIYDLLMTHKRSPGAWIGESISLKGSSKAVVSQSLLELASRPKRRLFDRCEADEGSQFLDLRCVRFEEKNAAGAVIRERALEFVIPRILSDNTVAVALLRSYGGQYYIGLDDDDLPAAQCFTGNSQLFVTPAWRMPRTIRSMTPARRWVRERLGEDYGLTLGQAWELGGYFYPSPGVTPEIVYPLAIEVLEERDSEQSLIWVNVRDAIEHRETLNAGHLTTLLFRVGHALDLLT